VLSSGRAGQGYKGGGSPRWCSTVEVAEQRWHNGISAAMTPPNSNAVGFLGTRERERAR
jgi:hypothetical protein